MKRVILAIITLLLTLTPLSTPVAAASDVYFEDATFDYYLSKNADNTSTMQVKETLTAIFPESSQNHGITRVIPYTNQDGTNLTMRSATELNISVTRNGEPENIAKIESEDGAFIVYIGHSAEYVHGEQVYVLEYEFENVITEFDGYQELYWDTNGTGWTQTFDNLTANLHFSGNIPAPDADQAWCYVGRSGSSDQSRCEINNIYDGLTFTTSNLRAGENLTLATQFPEGTFTVPIRKSHILVAATVILAIISLALIIYLIYAYRKYARANQKYHKGLLTPVQYTPPKGFTVAEVSGAYLKGTKDARTATLLELATSHKIELKETGKKQWSIIIKDASNLTPLQTLTLRIFAGEKRGFTTGDEIPIERHSSYSSERANLFNSFSPTVKNSLIEKGILVKQPASVLASTFSILYIGLLAGGLFGLSALIVRTYSVIVGQDYLWSVMAIIAAITVTIAGILASQITRYAKYTHQGLDLSNYAAGLKEYISLAEKDRLKVLQSAEGTPKDTAGIVRLYEKLLPYAALFGLEKSWLAQLQVYYNEDPSLIPAWYVSTTVFSARDFSSALSSMHSSISSMASSSSSSGSGGGGFSGGGGGGGGGGTW